MKLFVKGQKNDGNDAEAICIAVQQPHMRFVPKKSLVQQDIQGLHRARQRLVNHRVALICQMRGLLLERGVAIAKSASVAQRLIPEIINNAKIDISELTREIIGTLHAFLLQLNDKIKYFDKQIEAVFRESEACQRIAKVRGIGPKTATALVAAVGDGGLLGGRIGVESVIGCGSTFWFEIPVERGRPPPEPKAINPETQIRLPRLSILVVEDNAVNLHVATKFLAHLGQVVDTAENGAIAVAMAAGTKYDLILMDMQMPVMDGIEATSRIRVGAGMSSRAPIVAMTANASDDDMRRCLEAGMDGFQSKPVSVDKLREVIRKVAISKDVDGGLPFPLDRSLEVHQPASLLSSELDLSDFKKRRAELVDVLGEEDFAELVACFFADARAALTELDISLARHDAALTDRVLHTIKGATGNVGLRHLALLAQRLRESSFDQEDLNMLSSVVDRYALTLAA